MSSSLAPPTLRQAHRHSSYGPGELGHRHPSLSLHVPPPMPPRRTSAGARPGRPTSQTFRPSPLAGPVLSYDSLIELAPAPTMGRPQKSASVDGLSCTAPRRRSMLAAYARLPVVVIGDAVYLDRPLGAGAESRPAARRFASASSTASSADSTLLTPTPPTSLLSARSSATSLSSQSGSSAISVHVRTSVNAAAKPANAGASASTEPKSLKKPPEVKHNWLVANPTPLFSRSALRTQGVVMPVRASVSASSTGSGSVSRAQSVRSSRSVSSGETVKGVMSVKGKAKEEKEVVAALPIEEDEVERKVETSSRLARNRTLSTAPKSDTGLNLRRRMTRAGSAAAGTVVGTGEEQSGEATEYGEKGKRTRRMSLTWALGLAQVQRKRTASAAGRLTSTSIPVTITPTSTSVFEAYRENDAGRTKIDGVIETEMEVPSSSSSVSSSTSSMLAPAFASSSMATSMSTSVANITATLPPPTQSTKTPLTTTTTQGSLCRAWKRLRRLSSVPADTNPAPKPTSKTKPESESSPIQKLGLGQASDGGAGREHQRGCESKLERLELGLGPENGDKFKLGAEAKVERAESEKPAKPQRMRLRSFFGLVSDTGPQRAGVGAVHRFANGVFR